MSTSLASLRRHEPDLPVSVFSRYALPGRAQADHIVYDNEHHPLKQKVLVLAESPYEQTLFLDTDTTILGPITPVFDRLADANFAVAHASLVDRSQQPWKLLELENPDEYNTGVLLFDDSAPTRTFLQRWRDAVMPQDPADMWAGSQLRPELLQPHRPGRRAGGVRRRVRDVCRTSSTTCAASWSTR